MVMDAVKTQMTAEEFETLPESNSYRELIEGELVVQGTPKIKHQRVSRASFRLIDRIAPNGELFYAPVSVYLDAGNYYQPDILWVAERSACQIGEGNLIGAPDLVVEVLSPGTEKVDRGIKFRKYQEYGVREYWIANPELAFLEVWVLENGHFIQQGDYEAGASFHSPVLDVMVTLDGVF